MRDRWARSSTGSSRVDLGVFGGSALTDPAIAVPTAPSAGIPVTYVPARNTILLALALAYAEVIEADAIFTGANAVDYSGYPDCRPEYLAAFEAMANLATKRAVEGSPIAVRAPIVRLGKAEIVRRGHELGVDFALTVSCYDADARGRACGRCDACRLRREGFAAAGLADPTRYRAEAGNSLLPRWVSALAHRRDGPAGGHPNNGPKTGSPE